MAGQKYVAYDDLFAKQAAGEGDIHKLRPNTIAVWDGPNKAFYISYYDTLIAHLHDGWVKVYTGGYHTVSTQNRINDVLMPLGWQMFQRKGNLYVQPMSARKTWTEFREGMVLNRLHNEKDAS